MKPKLQRYQICHCIHRVLKIQNGSLKHSWVCIIHAITAILKGLGILQKLINLEVVIFFILVDQVVVVEYRLIHVLDGF